MQIACSETCVECQNRALRDRARRKQIAVILLGILGLLLIGDLRLATRAQAGPDPIPPAPEPALPPEKGDEAPRAQTHEDLVAMHRGALIAYNMLERRLLAGQTIEQEVVYIWSRRVLKAQLRLCNKKVDRLAAFEAFLDRTRKVVRGTVELQKLDDVRSSDVSFAMMYRNLAMELLFAERGGKETPWRALEPIE